MSGNGPREAPFREGREKVTGFSNPRYAVESVTLSRGGAGFGSSMDLEAVAFPVPDTVEVLRPPTATLVLGPRGASARAEKFRARPRLSYLDLGDAPPPPPATAREASLIGSLLNLAPPEAGAPTYDRYADPPRHRFPAASEETRDAVEAKNALFFWTEKTPNRVVALPTAVSGGVRRDVPLTPPLLGRLALAGGACGATTRALTSPLDRRKTRAQAGLDGEAGDAWGGVDASAAAGFSLGAGSFGTYEALKRFLPAAAVALGGAAAPVRFETPLLLAASAGAVAVSVAVAAPFESARAAVMSGKEASLGDAFAAATDGVGVRGLWSGAPALFARELPFTVAKLLVYAAAQEALLASVPAARERPEFGFAVSLSAGVLAGLAAAILSAPADTVVTQLAAGGHGSDWRAALADVWEGAESPSDRARALWAGTPARCAQMAVLVTAQFVLFDVMRTALAVAPKDLSLALDVFSDRLQFYEGWDEVSEAWVDALSEVGDLL